jgi:hypothetical protein
MVARRRLDAFAKVRGMSNEYVDPSGDTEQFKAFVHAPQEQTGRSRTPLIIGGVVAVALLALVVVILLG